MLDGCYAPLVTRNGVDMAELGHFNHEVLNGLVLRVFGDRRHRAGHSRNEDFRRRVVVRGQLRVCLGRHDKKGWIRETIREEIYITKNLS